MMSPIPRSVLFSALFAICALVVMILLTSCASTGSTSDQASAYTANSTETSNTMDGFWSAPPEAKPAPEPQQDSTASNAMDGFWSDPPKAKPNPEKGVTTPEDLLREYGIEIAEQEVFDTAWAYTGNGEGVHEVKTGMVFVCTSRLYWDPTEDMAALMEMALAYIAHKSGASANTDVIAGDLEAIQAGKANISLFSAPEWYSNPRMTRLCARITAVYVASPFWN